MPQKISHVGIAVANLEEAMPFYRDVLGMTFEGTEVVAEQKVKVAFFAVGESRVELLEPTADDSPVAKFLEKNGEGTHHVAARREEQVPVRVHEPPSPVALLHAEEAHRSRSDFM